MSNKIVTGLLLLTIIPVKGFPALNFIVDIKPASILISPKMDEFSVQKSTWYFNTEERIESSASWLPMLNVGIGISIPSFYIDLTGGAGFIVNGAFYSPIYSTDLALRFKLGKTVTLGPHVGAVFLDPSWDGETSGTNEVYFSNSTGLMSGLCFTIGHSKVAFSLSLDYFFTTFDVETNTAAGWQAKNDKLDLSGFSINMGVILRL